MTLLAVVGIAVAGAIGAPARYLVDGFVQDRSAGSSPGGPLVVSVPGSSARGGPPGLVAPHAFAGAPRLWLATGLCGAFTTFSTFSWETVRLLEEGEWGPALANVGGSVLAGLAAAAAGMSAVYLLG